MHHEPAKTSIESIRVAAYKNLADIDLAWSHTVVLLGANGAGKTNLLECLALLFGTDRTLDLVRGRAAPVAGGQLSCILRAGPWILPMSPAAARRIAARGSSSGASAELEQHARTALAWWEHLGGTNPDAETAAQAFIDTPLARPVAVFLAEQAAQPRVLYELHAMPSVTVARRKFIRTLVADTIPEEVLAHADDLPPAFEPMRGWAAGPRRGPAFVCALPDADAAPIRVEWLARQRSAQEIDSDLVAAMNEAEPHAQHLASLIANYFGGPPEAEGRWWLHEHGAARANEELVRTMPELALGGIGDVEESWRVSSDGRDAGATDGTAWAEHLSSGERRWADEALATAARSISDLGRRCAWQSFFWDRASADDAEVVGDALRLLSKAETDEIVGADVLAETVQLFDRALTRAARAWTTDAGAAARELIHVVVPAVEDLTRPPLTVRVFDEPEAHLHPAAQRRLSRGLAELAAVGPLVLASHSPYLLGRTDWTYCAVSGGRASTLPTHTLDASSAIATELGWTRGEVLVSTRAVLLVEGSHDQVFLQGLYGSEFRDAGVVIVPIRGTTGARSLIDAEFWRAFTDTPFHVMFDGTRLDAVRDRTVRRDLSSEERQMRDLLDSVEKTGRRIGAIGLRRPDIVTYIAEQVLPASFPGSDSVLARWARDRREYVRRTGNGLKEWLVDQFGLPKLTTARVAAFAAQMARGAAHPPGDLAVKIQRLLADPERMRS